jgi:hypothetical protein
MKRKFSSPSGWFFYHYIVSSGVQCQCPVATATKAAHQYRTDTDQYENPGSIRHS